MIVDKQSNLNIYKEDTRKLGKDKEISKSSCCGSDRPKVAVEAMGASCCGSSQTPSEAGLPKTNPGSCCGTSDQTQKAESRNIEEIDFNEWVGELFK
jgi:hypothetical protein